MPELPEVETVARDIDRLAAGRVVASVQVRLNKIVRTGPRRLARLLTGRTLLAARRWGKQIVIEFSDGAVVVVHLKMTGQFLWGALGGEWEKHVHVVFGFDDGQALLYRDVRQFGYLMGFTGPEFDAWRQKQAVGPDPFQLTPEAFADLLAGRRGRIKALLLNQAVISGLGNIYADEALFAAGVHPCRPAGGLTPEEAARLHEKIDVILKEAIRLRGSTRRDYVGLDGRAGRYQQRHQVYGQAGEACPVCGRALERLIVAGRSTHLCACCQPAGPA